MTGVEQEAIPTISVDRTVGQYFDSIDFDIEAIKGFYEGLPFENKRPLGECHIHFSALGVLERAGVVVGGAMYINKAKNTVYDPQTPPSADISIFLGTSLMDEDSDHRPFMTLGHELTHYAENPEAKLIPENIRALSMEHTLLTSPSLRLGGFVIKNTVMGVLLYKYNEAIGLSPAIPIAAAQLAVGNVGARFISKIRQKKSRRDARLEEIRDQLLANYHEDSVEHNAIEAAGEMRPEALQLTPKEIVPDLIVRRRGRKNRLIDFIHRRASLGEKIPVKNKA